MSDYVIINADHPHSDPGDGRSECETCGKWVWLASHSCKGVPVTDAAMERWTARYGMTDKAIPSMPRRRVLGYNRESAGVQPEGGSDD